MVRKMEVRDGRGVDDRYGMMKMARILEVKIGFLIFV